MMKTVFCDESGFTGENLWQGDQPHFVYAAVCISEDEAAEIVDRTRKEFGLQGAALHAVRMLGHEKGTKAVISIVESLAAKSSVAVFHKRYALAAKMFEYLIEPAISAGNSIFYGIGLHKFVANGLYLALTCEPETTEHTFLEFQEALRNEDIARLEFAVNSMNLDGMAGLLGQISTFAACNKRALQRELSPIETPSGIPRWLLELTMTALTSLLATFSGEEMVPLSVTCDNSKPLLNQSGLFDGFVGRTDYHEMFFDGRRSQLTFNLAHQIRFGKSKTSPGIQVADVVAGAAACALKNPDTDFARRWHDTCSATLHKNSVLPDLSEVDLTTERGFVSACVLNELTDRSVRGESLLRGMKEFIEFTQATAPQFLGSLDDDSA